MIRVNDTRLNVLRDNVGTVGFEIGTDTILDLILDLQEARRVATRLAGQLELCIAAGKSMVRTIQELEQ